MIAPPGAGGSGGFAGGPGSTGGTQAAGGASGACFRGCGFAASIPVLFPAYALIHGNKLTMEISCTVKCHGTGSLHQSSATTAAKHKKGSSSPGALASFSFNLRAKGVKKITATLTPAGRKLLAHKQRLIVSATLQVIIGNARPRTYASALDVTRSAPKSLHLKGLRMAIRLR